MRATVNLRYALIGSKYRRAFRAFSYAADRELRAVILIKPVIAVSGRPVPRHYDVSAMYSRGDRRK